MNIALCVLLGLYFGCSIILVGLVKDEEDRIYMLRHPFGGLMIFLFGPIIVVAFCLVPGFYQRTKEAMRAKG